MSSPVADLPGSRRLVLLRHGQTAWNAERRAQGHADVELDDTGRAQAAAVAPYVAAMRPRYVWSSDLARARETGACVAAEAGLELRLDDRLREYHLGERTGLTMAEYAAAHPDEYRAYRCRPLRRRPRGRDDRPGRGPRLRLRARGDGRAGARRVWRAGRSRRRPQGVAARDPGLAGRAGRARWRRWTTAAGPSCATRASTAGFGSRRTTDGPRAIPISLRLTRVG